MMLYGFPPSPRTWVARAVAAQLGIPLEFEIIDLSKGQQQAPDYRAINPTGRTPTLVDGDFKLWETTAIMHYLAGQRPNTLWPDDVRSRADIVRWQSWTLAHWEKESCVPLVFERLVKPILGAGPPDEAAIARGLTSFARDAKVLEAHLASRPYLVGNALTLADFSVAGPLVYFERAGIPLADYPKLHEWFGRVTSLPCWKETAPQAPAAAA
ncbi:MAG: glutathione S-transferase family protein [Proteobacteria bacterium]|nr:glutathione S-transferase family protein [Pseudomonadota bacterium]